MSLELEDREFVALDAGTIKELLASGQREALDRRGPERRRVERWPFPATVQLRFKTRSGDEVEIIGTCENLNETGIGVMCERPFEVGLRLPISIHQPEATYHGEGVVRHCTPSKGEYFVGIELVEPKNS